VSKRSTIRALGRSADGGGAERRRVREHAAQPGPARARLSQRPVRADDDLLVAQVRRRGRAERRALPADLEARDHRLERRPAELLVLAEIEILAGGERRAQRRRFGRGAAGHAD